jgi:hypothetical protein
MGLTPIFQNVVLFRTYIGGTFTDLIMGGGGEGGRG